MGNRIVGPTVFVLVSVCSVALSASAERRPPNFVIVFTDDQGYNDLGCFGSKKIETPHIDRLAAEGMRLTSFYAQAVCGPSRAALLTGCYPIRVAEPGNTKHQHTILHPRETTLAETLQTVGYTTACIGKWHLGLRRDGRWDPQTMPNGQGFDYFYGTPLYNGFTVRVEDTDFRSPLFRNDQVAAERIETWDRITQDYTDEAIRFMRRNRDRPFFLYLAHNMPHVPLGASEAFRGKSEYGPYGDAIEEIDASTGQIVAALKDLGLDRDTLLVYTSDNGPWIETTRGNAPDGKPFIPAEHSGLADPLRGYKMLTWEGGLRVPCVVWWPGRVPAGTTSDEVAATIDLFPTLANLAGARPIDDRILDGRDIWPLISGKPGVTSPHDAFFYFSFTHLQAARSGPWKLVLPRPEHPKWVGWSGRFWGSGVDTVELYNLDADPGETNNVADQRPEVVERMMKLVVAGRADLGDYDRIGKGARFFDDGPRRPESRRWIGSRQESVEYDHPTPVGNLRFDFETGDLQGWKVIEGSFEALVNDRSFFHHTLGAARYNKQGKHFLTTLERAGGGRGNDQQTGIVESPVFTLRGDRASFLVGGGRHANTYVALVDAESGEELLTARGENTEIMRRIDWDVAPLEGRRVRLRLVDRNTGGWGHVTFDDFSCSATLDD